MILVDTSVAIDYARGKDAKLKVLDGQQKIVAVRTPKALHTQSPG